MSDRINLITATLAEILTASPSTFLVEVEECKPDKYVVYLDDDQGITLDMVVNFSNQLRPKLESLPEFASGEFILEVSSASLERPLKLFRQYQKNLQRKLKLHLISGAVLQGKFTELTEEQIQITTTTNQIHRVAFKDIKSCYVLPF